jgi:hypothetical protein
VDPHGDGPGAPLANVVRLCCENRGHDICCPRGQHLILTLVRLVQWAHVRIPLFIDTGVGFDDVGHHAGGYLVGLFAKE